MLFTLLFNIVSAAVLLITLQRFSRKADILGDLVHLDESPKGMGPETALDVVMRAPFGVCCTPTMPALYRDHRKVLQK